MTRLLPVVAAVLLMCAVLPQPGRANDYSISFTRTIAVADTLADSIYIDTVWDNTWIELRKITSMNFWYGLYGTTTDTAFTADSFFLKFMHGPRRSAIDAHVWDIATFTTITDSLIWGTFNPSRTDSVIGNWGRFFLIHKDSNEADIPDLLGNSYQYDVEVWTTELQ